MGDSVKLLENCIKRIRVLPHQISLLTLVIVAILLAQSARDTVIQAITASYRIAGQTTGEIGCFIMETMRLVPSNVAGARVSRFPRRKRGINSRASVVRRRSRRWYLGFKSELFTLFPTSCQSSPIYVWHIRRERKE